MGTETVEAARQFIVATAVLPDHERDQARAEALNYARLGEWHRFPLSLATWFRQVVKYLDSEGPEPEYWPESTPW